MPLAHLGHGCKATSQLADDLVVVAAQLVDVDVGRAKINAERCHVADFVHYGGDVRQRLGLNAADIQADAAERRITLDQHHLQAQIGRAKSSRGPAPSTSTSQSRSAEPRKLAAAGV